MNRDQIIEFQPGKELDKLVAEKVLGHQIVSVNDDDDYHYEHGSGDISAYSPLPMYSTSLSAAEKVLEKYDEVTIEKYHSGAEGARYIVKIFQDGDFTVNSSTLPEGICKAALLVALDIYW